MKSLISTYAIPLQWDLPGVPEELLWYMTAAFLMLALAYLSSVFYFRTRLKSKASREAELKNALAPMISKFLFFTDEDPLEARREYVQLKIEIRQLLKDGLTRTVLSEVLQDLKKDVSGSARKELLNLYSDLGLQEDAIQRLSSRRWEVLSRAILELTAMEVKGAYGLIKKYINHRSSVVRKQAQLATVSLKTEGITYFLDSNRYPISEWQQLKLLDVIRHLEGFKAPKFKDWLTSKNAYVVLFALRLIKYYKQNDASSSIITLLNHRNQQIRIEAIQCVREFFIREAKEPLKKTFAKGNEEVKLLILDTLGLIGSPDDIEFLQSVINKTNTHVISSKASSVINTLKPGTILPEADIEPLEEIVSNPSEDKPEEMQKEEKETFSVHLPKPDFKEDPMAWEDVLNPEFEDEVIFSHCCLQEFRELIQEIGEPVLQAGDPGTLPLDFLPLIVEESTEQHALESSDLEEEAIDASTASNSRLDYTMHPEERITREIEALLSSVNDDKPDLHEEEDVFDLNFLPILIDKPNTSAVEQDKQEELDFRSIEVIAETLKHEMPEAFTKTNKASENYSVQVPPEESFEAVKSINWSAIASQKLQLNTDEEEDSLLAVPSEEMDDTYGFSIFQELFRTADTESKLILLDEVLAVGDEKELYFLQTLSADPTAQIRKKAALIYDELVYRLREQRETEESEIEEDLASPESCEAQDILFELSFEPEIDSLQQADIQEQQAAPGQQHSKLPETDSSGSLMGRFTMLTHKILEKIYG